MYNRFYKTNFIFVANRYEEWQGGQCISQGAISTKIVAEVKNDIIHFELDNIGSILMLKSFDFGILGEDYCVLNDRIQYIHDTSDFNPVVPIVCHLFYSGSTMPCVRFAMTNPDRIVEFYGGLLELGQPSTGMRNTQHNAGFSETAESILKQLNEYGMLNSEAIMERAVKLFNENAEAKTIAQAKAIIESLKLFVKVYLLDKREHEFEDRVSTMKPKILMFIAICNYKIDNVNRAYCIAKQGLDAVDEAIEDSAFIGIPRSMYGSDTLQELVDVIENNRFDDVEDEDNYYNIAPEEVDTSKFEEFLSQMKMSHIFWTLE